jgi:hypothetical protein
MSSHAPFAPSSATRWLTCTGSFGLGLQLPEAPSSEYADEGTRLHDVAAAFLRYSDNTGKKQPHSNCWPSHDDIATLKPYIDYGQALLRVPGNVCYIEERLEYSALLFGTADLLAVSQDWLEIVDLKTGAGIMVEPEENDQLLAYAFMALKRFYAQVPGKKARPTFKGVRLTIVQPPDEDRPVKSWETTSDHVMAWGVKAEAAIQAALAGSIDLVPGEHCRFCKAKPVCPKLMGHVTEALPVVVRELRPDKLAGWLDKADLMQQWLDALREVAHDLACEGHPIPGYELKPKRATRSWSDEDKAAEIARAKRMRIFQPRKLMSPAMAEKAHPNLPEELTSLIVAISSGSNLVKSKGKPQALPVALESEAKPMDKLMANFALMKHRR